MSGVLIADDWVGSVDNSFVEAERESTRVSMNRLLAFFGHAKPFVEGAGSLFDFANSQGGDVIFDVSTEQDEWEQVSQDLSAAYDEFAEAY